MMNREVRAESGERETSARPRVLWWIGEAGIFAAILFGFTTWQERHLLDDATPAPEFSLTAVNGERFALQELRGKRVLLHFWATWCGVCRREFGALNAVHGSLGEDEMLVSVVADGQDAQRIRRFARDNDLEYPVLLATDDVIRAFRIGAYPTNYFLDENGMVRGQTVGMSTRWGLSTRLAWATP